MIDSTLDRLLKSKFMEVMYVIFSWVLMLGIIAVVGWYSAIELGIIDNPNKRHTGDCYSSDCSNLNEYPN